ncbi:unannotated protein [freshwater metagenome]|uniref:Unannotated protein n=1 Tax=freshwater metagenome TaxID=449393 RepID=A0A6J7EGG0_9ZZZZ
MPDGIGTPAGVQHADELLHARTTLAKVRAHGRVFLLGPSGTEAHNEPASGEVSVAVLRVGDIHEVVLNPQTREPEGLGTLREGSDDLGSHVKFELGNAQADTGHPPILSEGEYPIDRSNETAQDRTGPVP